MATPEQSTNAAQTGPAETESPGIHQPETASPGFHLPDTLDWSSLFVQMKNRVIVIPSGPPRWMAPYSGDEGTDDSQPQDPTVRL